MTHPENSTPANPAQVTDAIRGIVDDALNSAIPEPWEVAEHATQRILAAIGAGNEPFQLVEESDDVGTQMVVASAIGAGGQAVAYTDDRVRPLLLAQADKRGAAEWRYEDVEPVIASLLARIDALTHPAPSGQAVADLTYGKKLIAEAIVNHFGERDERYEEYEGDTTVQDVWEAFDALSAIAHPVQQGWRSRATDDVLSERQRQVEVESWTAEHDDIHGNGEMAKAAASYAIGKPDFGGKILWPWDSQWWKPSGRRRNLIKAGALILAEIERLDRLPVAPKGE